MKIERLETERLILRTYEERDLQDLYEYLSDEDVVAFEPYEPMNLEEVKKCLEDRIVSGEFLAIEERITGKMIGNIYVSERYAESVEIGYVVNRRFWKKGYAYEACNLTSCQVCARQTAKAMRNIGMISIHSSNLAVSRMTSSMIR